MTAFEARPATATDVPRILALITGMFDDLGTTVADTTWQGAAHHRLTTDPNVGAFVTVDGTDRPIAVAVGVIDHRLPSPRRPAGRLGYVEWLATDPQWRRRGAARWSPAALLRWFDAQHVPAIDVHTSAAARPLYETLGFRPPSAVSLRRTANTSQP